MTDNNAYWTGPYGVLVPSSTDRVVASDGYNSTSKNGKTTRGHRKNAPKINADIYRQRYAIFHADDGKWYYHVDKYKDYWIGPYGVLVPLTINQVVARDGGNYQTQDGGQSEVLYKNAHKMTADIYREKYAIYHPGDDQWYYRQSE